MVEPLTGPWPLRPGWTRGAAALAAHKQGQRVAVVVPAKDEERTVAGVVGGVVTGLVHDAGLVDEVLVVDGRSEDATAEVARQAGARVLSLPETAHGHPLPGKGGALWWAQLQTDADLLVFLDADVSPSRPDTVVQLLAPLLLEPSVSFVKAAFDRPLTVDGLVHAGSGGRVTELLARPLLNALWPELAGFVQPLGGEVALRRALCASLPFSVGYGLELGMLLDVLDRVGPEGMAQVDIGERVHRHHSDAAVGVMSAGVLAVALARLGVERRSEELEQFSRTAGQLVPRSVRVPVGQLPPAGSAGERC
ncbi:MAG: glycosyl transferase family 2 [Frankiales bacterium]|nr:glycosyl transferase family 2 [Frankiales bacterium]